MKSQLSIEKTASSALLFAVLGWLTTSLSPALAAGTAPDAPIVQSPTQGFLASTDLPKASEPRAAKSVANWSAIATSTNIPPQSVSLATSVPASSGSSEATDINVKDLIIPSLQAQSVPNSDASPSESPAPTSLDAIEPAGVDDPMGQVTNVSQLTDVKPSDWAYQSLRDLVERYGCIAGYPDGFFRGNRALSRYEFAAGVNACLKQIERLLPDTSKFASQRDLESLRRLVQEFQAELATLGTRVDKLDGRTSFLENHQFSTTTKLFGQVIFGVQGHTENSRSFGSGFTLRDPFTSINLVTNVQLSLFTQLSERSILLTGLAAGNGFTGSLSKNFTSMGYEGNTNGAVQISDLTYRQLIGNNLAFIVGAAGVNPISVFRGTNRVESAGFGPLSRFAQRNPIIGIGNGNGGAGFDWQIAPPLSLQAVYATSRPGDPANGGILGGTSGESVVGAQLTVSPTDNIDLAFQYVNAYSPFGRLGAGIGDDQLAITDPVTQRAPLQTNGFGATLEWRVTPAVTFGGWGGYTTSYALGVAGGFGTVETLNWMGYLNFPDLFGEGNLGGIYVGQPPKIFNSNLPTGLNVPSGTTVPFAGTSGGQPGTTTHVEAFYRFRVSDNISITPGVIVLFNQGHTVGSDTITIGALRTTFTF